MAKQAIFLDRDGVIIRDKSYMHDPADIEFLPSAIEGLRALQAIAPLFIITNQSGIARGYFTLAQAQAFNDEVVHRLAAHGVVIAKTYLCSHHPEFTGACECRKPKTGLATQAARDFDLDLSQSFFIGDRDSDTELGKNCGGFTVLVASDRYETKLEPNFRVTSLFEAFGLLQKAGLTR